MTIPDVSNTTTIAAYQNGGQKSQASSSLGKDGFLKLLTAQMKNQDPNSNQDPSQYFETISQMTMVEQMTNLATAQSKSSAQNLLGHTVTYQSKDGSKVTGAVTAVDVSSSNPTVTVAGKPGVSTEMIREIT